MPPPGGSKPVDIGKQPVSPLYERLLIFNFIREVSIIPFDYILTQKYEANYFFCGYYLCNLCMPF
jgi:hypothetical protein